MYRIQVYAVGQNYPAITVYAKEKPPGDFMGMPQVLHYKTTDDMDGMILLNHDQVTMVDIAPWESPQQRRS